MFSPVPDTHRVTGAIRVKRFQGGEFAFGWDPPTEEPRGPEFAGCCGSQAAQRCWAQMNRVSSLMTCHLSPAAFLLKLSHWSLALPPMLGQGGGRRSG